jgi:chromosome segregation ATPase
MLDLIKEEGKTDKENLDWCNKERKDNKAELKEKKKEILALEKKIDKLTKTIEDPKTGLKKQIADTEDALVKNTEAQKTETAQRLEENMAYQKDVKNLVAAEGIITKALKVLKAYYKDLEAKLEETAFVQEDPKPPNADLNMKGQSSKGGDVMDMLEFILKETNAEETQAHKDEEEAQADYEDSMTQLKKEEAKAQKNLASLQEDLAEAEEKLLTAQEDLKATTEAKESIEAYLLKIKPGCDFIDENFKLREKNRSIEKKALERAIKLIKGTPAYKTWEDDTRLESYGDCKEPCDKDEADVKCKACMADVTIPAYCAGHKGTKGC